MAPAMLRHMSATRANWGFAAGALDRAAACSKCAAASSSSAAERGPTSQASDNPPSTAARMMTAASLSGAAFTTLADSALSPSSFHHSGLGTSLHCSSLSLSKAHAVAIAQSSEPTGWRSLASRNHCAASTWCPELPSAAPRLKYASGSSGLRTMALR
eukprot:scaffold1832_cov32-Phaeocystis_antarctica.AAC.2